MSQSARHVYVASKGTHGDRDGIHLLARDVASGSLALAGVSVPSPAASFLALHPDGAHLYATSALDEGAVAAFRITTGARLHPLGVVATGGSRPCHLVVHPSGRFLLTAHYGSGHVAVHRIGRDGAVGELCDLVLSSGRGPVPGRQEHAHAHFVLAEPAGRYVVVADLGTDSITTYVIDEVTGRLREVARAQAEPGSGPRHLVAHPDGFLLATGELASRLLVFDVDAETGAACQRGSVPATVAETSGENAPSELALGPTGRYCYVANRGADCVSVFELRGGHPVPVADVSTRGKTPRHLAVVGGYLYVANQDSATVVTFELDSGTGLPRATGNVVEVERPYCILATRVTVGDGSQR
ncbi:MAG: lactonase family protein [Acidimicrobiales bacterium]